MKYFWSYKKEYKKLRKSILKSVDKSLKSGNIFFGNELIKFEKNFKKLNKSKYGLAVGSGTEALYIALKSFGIGHGDEVITVSNTAIPTASAITSAGAKIKFVDIDNYYLMDASKIKREINKKTKAIIPVHLYGQPCDMDKINKIAEENNLYVIEDACHAIQAEYNGRRCGSLGKTGCFSFHPLKNLNVWGDGGIITTNDYKLAEKLKLIRNHGLIGRNTCVEFAYNSRLDSIQAVVAKHVLENKLENITSTRIKNAMHLDKAFSSIDQIKTTKRNNSLKEVFHLYMFQTDRREDLYNFLREHNIDAKVHYPIPMHLQPAAEFLGHKKGDFPIAESLAEKSISLPVHEFISEEQVSMMIDKVTKFFSL